MKQLKTAGLMLVLIFGIAAVLASWYLVVILVVLFGTYTASRTYLTIQEVLNEPETPN